jgi:hypothetical protein
MANQAPDGRSVSKPVFYGISAKITHEVESRTPKLHSTNHEFIFDQTWVRTRDKGHLPLRNVWIFLDKHGLLANCETFHTQNVKRFTFFPQGVWFSPW